MEYSLLNLLLIVPISVKQIQIFVAILELI